jgi:lambda family phage portal protein
MQPLAWAKRQLGRAALAVARPLLGASNATLARPYNGVGHSDFLKNWLTVGSDINALVESAGAEARDKARDTVRKVPWATRAENSYQGRAIGTGIVPVFNHSDKAEAQRLSDLWLRWTDEADADELTDFYGLQSLACRTEFTAGECFARLRPRLVSDGLTVPLQLQLLEPEYLDLADNRPLPNVKRADGTEIRGNQVRWGIEFDQIGKRQAYHFYREHPRSMPMFGVSGEKTRVPASAVCHLFLPLRPGQKRGLTAFAPVMATLYKLENYDDAELTRKGLVALYAFFFRNPNNELTYTGTDTDEAGIPMDSVEPGTVYDIGTKELVSPSFPDVGGMYPEFMSAQLHKIAAGLRSMPFHILTGNLKEVNYSSVRADLIEFNRLMAQYQHQVMVFQFCRPVMKAWLLQAAVSGAIDAKRFARETDEYNNIDWRPNPCEWVDMEKELNARKGMVRSGFKSRVAVCAELGEDVGQIDEQNAADNARSDSMGLAYDSDGRRPDKGGAAQPSGQEQQPPKDGVQP